jgi:hypothetical protein
MKLFTESPLFPWKKAGAGAIPSYSMLLPGWGAQQQAAAQQQM